MVYESLKESILEGELKPNSKLSETEVAEKLGVSATPVREALKLALLLKSLDDILLHDRNISAYDIERKKEIDKEHITILNAIKDRDKIKAKEAMSHHIRNGYKYIEKHRKK